MVNKTSLWIRRRGISYLKDIRFAKPKNCKGIIELLQQYTKRQKKATINMLLCLEFLNCERQLSINIHSVKVYYDCNTEITVTAGATQAIATAIATVVCSGDEVIVFEPTYDAYEPLVELQGGKTVPIELKFPDFKPDWNEVKNAINLKTKAIIINSPHNPLWIYSL